MRYLGGLAEYFRAGIVSYKFNADQGTETAAKNEYRFAEVKQVLEA
jgi:hypothetical protein